MTSLEIDNQYLGYKIYYTLQYFSYDGAQVGFGGYAQFDYYLSHDPIQKSNWQTIRENAYKL
ncbi:MAG: hypothetical protein R2822_02170 [Spirosomataceae bacterium]